MIYLGSPCSKNCTTKEEKKITIARTTGSKQDDEFTVRTHTAPLTSLNPNSTYHATSSKKLRKTARLKLMLYANREVLLQSVFAIVIK